MKLTTHERHARLVKLVRRDYQSKNPGSRLFNNTSGVAWQGEPNWIGKLLQLFNPRPIFFGIPEPEKGRSKPKKSGGTDLLGQTYINDLPILTGIECKSGNAQLKPNQKIFRNWMKRINAFWYLARECTCQDEWEPVYKAGLIIEWIPVQDCLLCGGDGYILEE